MHADLVDPRVILSIKDINKCRQSTLFYKV